LLGEGVFEISLPLGVFVLCNAVEATMWAVHCTRAQHFRGAPKNIYQRLKLNPKKPVLELISGGISRTRTDEPILEPIFHISLNLNRNLNPLKCKIKNVGSFGFLTVL
jgi:hypothetical protein